MDLVLGLGLLAIVVWLWSEGRRAHEIAVRTCRETCRSYDLQLLDATVSLSKLSISQWRIKRTYQFHFSRDGVGRESGSITMRGGVVEIVAFEPT